MSSTDAKSLAAHWLLQPRNAGLSAVVVMLLSVATYRVLLEKPNHVPALRDVIPFVSNTYQYMTDMKSFLRRAAYVMHHRIKPLLLT
jgi:type II secretory pathway component PulM